MHRKLRRAQALLFAASLAASAPFALSQSAPMQQQPAPPSDADEVVRISTELVETDVMVFDKQGKFVEGLKPEQFELRVDGKPQAVSFFEAVTAGTLDEEAALSAARGLGGRARAGTTPTPLDRGRHFILFLDDLHVTPDALPRVRETLRRFIDEQMGQNDEVALFTATGQLKFLEQMTGEKDVLRLAVSRLTSRHLDTREGAEQTPMTEAQAYAIERNDRILIDYFIERLAKERRMPIAGRPRSAAPTRAGSPAAGAGGGPNIIGQLEQTVRARARNIVQQAMLGTRNTLTSLENVVRSASALPGRKVLFFVSGGFMLDPQNNSVVNELRRVTAAAARSGVVIYTLDSHGLATSPVIADASARVAFDPGGQLVAVNSASLSAYQEPLHTLAIDTGGRALLDTNDPRPGIARALSETSRYYLLAWRPDEPGRGRFRTVEVRVKDRPDLTVRMRRGYSDETPKAEAAKDSRKKDKEKKSTPESVLMAALRSPYPRRALPTFVSAGYTDSPAGDPQLTVSIEVDAEALGFNPDGSGEPAALDVVGAVVNDKGEAVSEFDQSLTVTPVQASRGRRRVIYNRQLQLKPGLYQVRAAARDQRTGRAGSSSQWLEVPDVKKSGLSLSSLFVGEVGDGSGQLAVCADRRFPRDSRLGFFLHVYNAAAPPDVALQVQIFRNDQPVVTRPLFKMETAGMPDLARLPYGEDLSLSSLPAGRYVLQVTAIDRAAKTSASRRASFVVE